MCTDNGVYSVHLLPQAAILKLGGHFIDILLCYWQIPASSDFLISETDFLHFLASFFIFYLFFFSYFLLIFSLYLATIGS